jgi:hypothetical protein
MNNLPTSHHLPIEYLAASFEHVTNSYKFYWFLALLEDIKERQNHLIVIDDLLVRIIASVWYPVNYFYLSFGKQDRLPYIVSSIEKASGLSSVSKKANVFRQVRHLLDGQSEISSELRGLARFVPYRFLRPFFANQLRGISDWKVDDLIADMAMQSFNSLNRPCLYRFVDSPKPAIEIHPQWFEYIQTHLPILSGFCLWHLMDYLQKNNPNVPNIVAKVFEPQQRDLRLAKKFWNLVMTKVGSLYCIYSSTRIDQNNFSLDHFLPWRFVAHDQLWNLIPAVKAVNSSKGDCLPDINLYLERFTRGHYTALHALAATKQTHLFEDYILLFKKENVSEMTELPFEQFHSVLRDAILPQIQIAKNMGFTANWRHVAA